MRVHTQFSQWPFTNYCVNGHFHFFRHIRLTSHSMRQSFPIRAAPAASCGTPCHMGASGKRHARYISCVLLVHSMHLVRSS
ncbi:hypothetical protein F7R13_17025 [Burkholderia territorii]|uniref:Uncharacterized protein n=1 Tax=Burkholderia territorii TaxID=1503055 RepID=A0A6L3NF45_9BURK|nr:hypothetical protein F7R13_17025 [Burkholderia territorii]